jgi:hypothetical protein
MRLRALAVVLSVGFTLSAAACNDRQYRPGPGVTPDSGTGGGGGGGDDSGGPYSDCGDPPPPSAPCFYIGCTSDVSQGYVCQDGAWVCPLGTTDASQDCWNDGGGGGGCSGDPGLSCVDGCGGDVETAAECVGSSWQCPPGYVTYDSCPADTCWGPPPTTCCDGSEPRCDGGDYVCPDGIPADIETCDMCPEASPVPPDDNSRQTVRFNVAARSGWVVTQGQGCGAVHIELVGTAGSEPLLQGLPYQVICEGPPPPPIGATTVVDLTAGAEGVVAWDARYIVQYDVCTDCTAQGWPGEGVVHSTGGYYRAATAGHYRATFAVEDDIGSLGCQSFPDGTATCNPPYDGGASYGQPYDLCNAQRVVTVEFDLPATGDLDVEVP